MFDDTKADRAETTAKTEKILDLLSLGFSGKKIEQAGPIVQKIDQYCVVSIDHKSSRLLLYDRDLDLTVLKFYMTCKQQRETSAKLSYK